MSQGKTLKDLILELIRIRAEIAYRRDERFEDSFEQIANVVNDLGRMLGSFRILREGGSYPSANVVDEFFLKLCQLALHIYHHDTRLADKVHEEVEKKLKEEKRSSQE